MTHWADGLTTIALRWRSGSQSIQELFEESAPPAGTSDDTLRAAVAERLRENPELVEAWQQYSYDKRGGLTVGFFDGQSEDVAGHATPIEACADFICRERQWVLHRRRSV